MSGISGGIRDTGEVTGPVYEETVKVKIGKICE